MSDASESKRYPSAVLAACTVPWDERNQFIEDLFREQVRLLRERLTRHLYIFGTAGEGYAVSDRQFDRIAQVFGEETSDADTHPMVGVISLSLMTVIERIERCLDMGLDTFQISLPSWGVLNDGEVDTFFAETCSRFPQARFLHYNLKRVGRMLTGSEYARLAADYPNLVAVKTGGNDRQQFLDLVQNASDIQCFFTEPGYAMVRDEHECGLLISLASINFQQARRYYAARGEELAKMSEQIQGIRQNMYAAVAGAGHMDGVYDKLYTKIHLPQFPLRLLPPYAFCDDTVFARFRDELPAEWFA